jgi:hypothetical protein
MSLLLCYPTESMPLLQRLASRRCFHENLIYGHARTIELLLKRAANVNAQDGTHRIGLQKDKYKGPLK